MTKKTRKSIQKVRDNYLNWLIRKVEDGASFGLEEFISDIHTIEFYCIIPNDDNRVMDGMALRNRYMDDIEVDSMDLEENLSGPCSMLEMLIALADRMDFILYDDAKGSRSTAWFWLFINNLRLQKYVPTEYDAQRKQKLNKMILKKFVARDYQPDGRGSIFPLRNPSEDQRKVEIWYQMMNYISENYGI